MALYTERYVLSVVYVSFAVYIVWADHFHVLGWVASDGADHPTFPDAATDVLMAGVQGFIGLMLLFGQRPTTTPQNLREFLVPLATAFYFLVYDALPRFPAAWQRNLWPTETPGNFWAMHPLDVAGLLLGVLGAAIALWGVVTLRRSFGIFVSVREVVLRGPYRFVRHPIYLGYVLGYGGWVLLVRTPAILLIATVHLALFVWRAKLEEARLAAHSPAYRAQMKSTGFLFPRIFGRG